MFGYVRLFKPNITMGEYEQYKGIYCTLCKRLGKRYGVASRFTLSYDMTFLALLEMALGAKTVSAAFLPGYFGDGRMIFNAILMCALDYLAAFTVLGLGGLFRNKIKHFHFLA